MTQTSVTRELFAKAVFKKAQVEAEAQRRRSDPGVVSASVEDGGDNWVLVTERAVIE